MLKIDPVFKVTPKPVLIRIANGFDLVVDKIVEIKDGRTGKHISGGALIQNQKTKIYMIQGFALRSVPQIEAGEFVKNILPKQLEEMKEQYGITGKILTKNFGQKWRELRLQLGLSLKDIHSALAIPIRTMEQWEAGKREPTSYTQPLLLEKLESLQKTPKNSQE